ncbi:hypothetical protein EJ110_NYTH32597 [Nymphaea thermarum]|nr:hypothetical protein EJ110_NYTH32597 [Nymphaea thermarum]
MCWWARPTLEISRPDPSYCPSPRNRRRRFPSRRIEFHRSSSGDGSDASNVEEAGGIVVDGGNVIRNLRISEPSSSRVDSSAVTGLSEGPLVSVVPASNGDVFRTRKESGCHKSGQDNELHELSMVSSGSKDLSEDGNGDDGGKPEALPLKIGSSETLKDSGFSETVGSHGISPVSSSVTEQIEDSGGRNLSALGKNVEEPVSESLVNADYTNRLALMECGGEELSGSSLDVAHGLPPNILISLAGFVIKVIGFQINLLVMFLGRLIICASSSQILLEPLTKLKNVESMFLGSFFILSFIILSSVLMGSFLEKPIRMTKPLSFDDTVTDPEALVPINAFEGIDYMQYCKGNVKAEKSEGRRFISPYHKLLSH